MHNSDQCCGLGDGQFTGRFPQIDIGSRLNSHGIVQKIEVVEIQRHDLILRIVAFNLNCDHPFDGFCNKRWSVLEALPEYNCFGQLLRDGRTTARILLAHNAAFHNGTSQRLASMPLWL